MQRIVDESNPCTQSSPSFCSKNYTHILEKTFSCNFNNECKDQLSIDTKLNRYKAFKLGIVMLSHHHSAAQLSNQENTSALTQIQTTGQDLRIKYSTCGVILKHRSRSSSRSRWRSSGFIRFGNEMRNKLFHFMSAIITMLASLATVLSVCKQFISVVSGADVIISPAARPVIGGGAPIDFYRRRRRRSATRQLV